VVTKRKTPINDTQGRKRYQNMLVQKNQENEKEDKKRGIEKQKTIRQKESN
jgi:hypothetical protein